MIVLGIDGGSRWCGASAVDGGIGVLAAGTFDVNPEKLKPAKIDVRACVTWLLGCAAISGAERIAVEHSDEWFPWPGATPQALKASAANWNVCDRIVRALDEASPIPVETFHRNTWACRVVPHKSGVSDADVRAALDALLPAESLAAVSILCPPCATATHQRDATGVALGAILAPAPTPPRERAARVAREPGEKRVRGPRAPRPGSSAQRNAGWMAKRKAAAKAAKVARGCRCQRRCMTTCPCYVPRPLRPPAAAIGPK